MVIALYTSEELSAKDFPRAKRDLMERLFAIRVAGSQERMKRFNYSFGIAVKEAIVRNGKHAEKINQIQLPDGIFERQNRLAK